VMAKKRSLMDELKGDPPEPRGRRWWHRLKPDDYSALLEACQDWRDGGKMKVWFPSVRSLHRYLSGEHPDIKCDPPLISIELCAFYRFIDHLGRLDGKETI